jgi:hypothetical protein
VVPAAGFSFGVIYLAARLWLTGSIRAVSGRRFATVPPPALARLGRRAQPSGERIEAHGVGVDHLAIDVNHLRSELAT